MTRHSGSLREVTPIRSLQVAVPVLSYDMYDTMGDRYDTGTTLYYSFSCNVRKTPLLAPIYNKLQRMEGDPQFTKSSEANNFVKSSQVVHGSGAFFSSLLYFSPPAEKECTSVQRASHYADSIISIASISEIF